MSELEQRFQEAGQLLSPPAHAGDAERALARFWALDRRRRHRRMIGASAALGASIIAAAYFFAPRLEPAPAGIAREDSPGPTERIVHFADGSQANMLSDHTVLRVARASEELFEIELEVGEARFDVAPNPRRLFRVVTRSLRVEVLGTSFTVSDEDGKSGVIVHRGRVAVLAGDSRHELLPGMSFEVDGREVANEEPIEVEEEMIGRSAIEEEGRPAPRPRKSRVKNRSRPNKPSWRHLAEEGLFAEAYEAMAGPEGESTVTDVQGLMLAADVARLTGHPQQAAGYLEAMITRHREAPQAVLAAFTLGRIRHRELKQPKEAAAAFETARVLGPDSSLATDALAHEVECWLEAGQRATAFARAELYLQQNPNGRRAERMRTLIGR